MSALTPSLPQPDRSALESAWREVERLAALAGGRRIESMYLADDSRSQRLTIDAAGLAIDLGRNHLDAQAIDALTALARAARVTDWRQAMFDGLPINVTEDRAVLHVALRSPDRESTAPASSSGAATLLAPLRVNGEDVRDTVRTTRQRMFRFCDEVRSGQWRGASGRPITDVVNIGIGGSQLGPELACDALHAFAHPRLRIHFLANVDPSAWDRLARQLNPATTLAIVASKSWRTQETSLNALAVREWMLAGGIQADRLHRHFVGVTANPGSARAFGLSDDGIFPFGDWVGGRYSLWSAIGLAVALQIGPTAFQQLLGGAHLMDRHFAESPLERNAPVLMALLSIWNARLWPGCTEVIVPYHHALRRLPAWLQQLQMESNGKRVGLDGRPVSGDTAGVCWGEPGTDAQHSFFQALHQGTRTHPVDFILSVPGPAHRSASAWERSRALLGNALAQAEALMCGRRPGNDDPLAAHRECPGDRPSSLIILDTLSPASLGALLALYEHKTAVMGWVLGIDSFDQWGVEIGKTLAAGVEPLLDAEGDPGHPDGLSQATLDTLAQLRRRGARPTGQT
jgi:glucose-6-phosphate isomerase